MSIKVCIVLKTMENIPPRTKPIKEIELDFDNKDRLALKSKNEERIFVTFWINYIKKN